MNEFILAALVFGLTAGFQPGPLSIIVIHQALTHGLKSGIKACLAPIITDGPIILAALFVLTQFKEFAVFINTLSLVGGLYLLWLSLKILKLKEIDFSASLGMSASLATAIKVNLLSPYPYLFWFTVGGAYLARGTQAESISFVAVVLTTLVLSKMLIAWIASNFRSLLDSTAYLWLMRVLGGVLSIFGLLLLYQSYNGFFN